MRGASAAKEERRTLEIQSSGGAAKSPTKNMNRKYAAWNTPRSAQSYFAFRLGELAAFQKATIRCCVRPAVGTHPCARRFSIALPRRRVRDNARGCLRTLRVRLAPNLPFESFRFLQHICQGGDRPPGSQPSGMSMSKFRSIRRRGTRRPTSRTPHIIPNRRARNQARRF